MPAPKISIECAQCGDTILLNLADPLMPSLAPVELENKERGGCYECGCEMHHITLVLED